MHMQHLWNIFSSSQNIYLTISHFEFPYLCEPSCFRNKYDTEKTHFFQRDAVLFSYIYVSMYVCVCKNWWWMMQISLLNTERLLLQRDSSFIMLSLYVNGKKVSIHKTYKQHRVGQKRGQVCIILIRNACITCQSWIHLANLSTWKWSNE